METQHKSKFKYDKEMCKNINTSGNNIIKNNNKSNIPYIVDLRKNEWENFETWNNTTQQSVLQRRRTMEEYTVSFDEQGNCCKIRNVAESSEYDFFGLEDETKKYTCKYYDTKDSEVKMHSPVSLSQLASMFFIA